MNDIRMQPGAFSWGELITDDCEAAVRFYKEAFDYTTETVDLGMGPYVLLKIGGVAVGGIMQAPEDPDCPRGWTNYITVEDINATVERVKSSGGTVILGPKEIPEVGTFICFVDPTGGQHNAIEYFPMSEEDCGKDNS